jgi:hypothetical protein
MVVEAGGRHDQGIARDLYEDLTGGALSPKQ